MSTLSDLAAQFPVSAGHSASTFSMPNLEDLRLKTANEIQIQAQSAYEEYTTRGDLDALEFDILCRRLIVEKAGDNHPKRAGALANLAVSLQARYESSGESQDLEESVSLLQLADVLTPEESPDRPRLLMNLSASLFSRFEREGKSEDLEGSIDLWTHALELIPDDHPDRPSLLNNLGASLHARFERLGTLDDLDRAVSLLGLAVELTPDGDPNKSMRLANLGNSLQARFDQLGDLEDIERVIELRVQPLHLTPDDHPMKPAYLSEAGCSLQARFDRLGDNKDLSLAIQFVSRAVEISPDSNPDKAGYLNNLAISLGARYGRAEVARDLEQAIAHQTHAVELTPDGHIDKPSRLNNLGSWLLRQFKDSGSLEVLDSAISHFRNAVNLTPDGHPDKQRWLHNLSISLQQRFDQVGDAADLDDAIRHSMQSVKLLPENHSERAQNLRHLGLWLLTRLRTPHALTSDATDAMGAFLQGMQHPASHPLEQLHAAVHYTELVAKFSSLLPVTLPLSLLEAHKRVLDLLPQCVWLGNSIRGRYTSVELHSVTGHARDSITAAIAAGEYSHALEWLETSHAVVWSQVLQLRTPADDLQRLHPQLADDLICISQALQHTTSSASMSIESLSTNIHLQSPHTPALEYNKLIAQIRQYEGFEDFMQPKTLPQLVDACAAGPVAIINIHMLRCDALILYGAGDVAHVPLPDFSLSHAEHLQEWLWDFLRRTRLLSRQRGELIDELEVEGRGIKPSRATEDAPDLMRQLLATLWVEVVKPIMDVIYTLVPSSTQHNGALPHVTWCPTGPLTFLPLHAAGIYPKDNDPQPLRTVMDVAISSYTPTLEALLKPRAKVASNGKYPKILIVSQPNTPNFRPIWGTTKEAEIITSLLDHSAVKTLNDKKGTVEAVLEGMATHNWVHLACHGIQDRQDPLNSSFALYNGGLSLETLATKHLPNADLAVLSACQTATGDEKLPEEAIHLAAGMLNIGYKSVIGTMWSIYDSSAPVVMRRFYEVMAEQVKAGGGLQPSYALHEATKALRAKYGATDFIRWMPFVHFGL